MAAFRRLQGLNAVADVRSGQIAAAKSGSPLVLGWGERGHPRLGLQCAARAHAPRDLRRGPAGGAAVPRALPCLRRRHGRRAAKRESSRYPGVGLAAPQPPMIRGIDSCAVGLPREETKRPLRRRPRLVAPARLEDRADEALNLPKETPHNPWVLFRYSFLQDAGFIGDDETVGGAPQSTNTVRRLAFGAPGFTALMIGVQAGGKRNRSLRASSDRETSSVNSWTDASNVRMRARPPTTTPVATPITVMAPSRSFHRTTSAILNASRGRFVAAFTSPAESRTPPPTIALASSAPSHVGRCSSHQHTVRISRTGSRSGSQRGQYDDARLGVSVSSLTREPAYDECTPPYRSRAHRQCQIRNGR